MATSYYFAGGFVDDLEDVLTVEQGLVGVNNENPAAELDVVGDVIVQGSCIATDVEVLGDVSLEGRLNFPTADLAADSNGLLTDGLTVRRTVSAANVTATAAGVTALTAGSATMSNLIAGTAAVTGVTAGNCTAASLQVPGTLTADAAQFRVLRTLAFDGLLAHAGSNILEADKRIDYRKWIKNGPTFKEDNTLELAALALGGAGALGGLIVAGKSIFDGLGHAGQGFIDAVKDIFDWADDAGGGDDGEQRPPAITVKWDAVHDRPLARSGLTVGFMGDVYSPRDKHWFLYDSVAATARDTRRNAYSLDAPPAERREVLNGPLHRLSARGLRLFDEQYAGLATLSYSNLDTTADAFELQGFRFEEDDRYVQRPDGTSYRVAAHTLDVASSNLVLMRDMHLGYDASGQVLEVRMDGRMDVYTQDVEYLTAKHDTVLGHYDPVVDPVTQQRAPLGRVSVLGAATFSNSAAFVGPVSACNVTASNVHAGALTAAGAYVTDLEVAGRHAVSGSLDLVGNAVFAGQEARLYLASSNAARADDPVYGADYSAVVGVRGRGIELRPKAGRADAPALFAADTTCRVGVGTRDPAERLHVVGGRARFDGGLTCAGTLAVGNKVTIDAATGALTVGALRLDPDGTVLQQDGVGVFRPLISRNGVFQGYLMDAKTVTATRAAQVAEAWGFLNQQAQAVSSFVNPMYP